MKSKKTVASLLAVLSILSVFSSTSCYGVGGPTVRVLQVLPNGAMSHLGFRYNDMQEQAEALVAWSLPSAPAGTTARIDLIRIIPGDATEYPAYSVAAGINNPPSGVLKWLPFAIPKIADDESYKVKVTWYAYNSGQRTILSTAESQSFDIRSPARSVSILPLDNSNSTVVTGTAIWVKWTSRNLPANADISLTLQDPAMMMPPINIGGTPFPYVSDVGAYLWEVNRDIPPGQYNLTVSYVNPYGVIGTPITPASKLLVTVTAAASAVTPTPAIATLAPEPAVVVPNKTPNSTLQ